MSSENLVASVLLVRRPVVIPKIDPVVYAFQEFSNPGKGNSVIGERIESVKGDTGRRW
ncbi:hypothetical protein LR48_Vigan11g021400 [Vigna angularis]|uniref:Uncharacterized protein n=1 Tax=Phaseolus angularis TaxID=3914 RepID=A0A0L9VQN8_PHAAN|nr:hypothetical protein LR48_Vigan11g021400 [Vigna angularis]